MKPMAMALIAVMAHPVNITALQSTKEIADRCNDPGRECDLDILAAEHQTESDAQQTHKPEAAWRSQRERRKSK
jgi:hypothetical protein